MVLIFAIAFNTLPEEARVASLSSPGVNTGKFLSQPSGSSPLIAVSNSAASSDIFLYMLK